MLKKKKRNKNTFKRIMDQHHYYLTYLHHYYFTTLMGLIFARIIFREFWSNSRNKILASEKFEEVRFAKISIREKLKAVDSQK